MSEFLRQAEDILDTAFCGADEAGDREIAIVLDRRGGMRILDPTGWTLSALSAEMGASAVFKVERRGATIRVEGLSGSERCLLQRNQGHAKTAPWAGMPGTAAAAPHAMMLYRPLAPAAFA